MKTSSDALVNIVIPNWNGKKFLGPCLDSLQSQTFSDFVVTVVDNGSVDNSLELLNNNYSWVRSISFAENRGFSAAVNAGIGQNVYPYVFLLNNDTELDENCLEQLINIAEQYSDYSFFSPKMLNYFHRDILDGAGDGFLRGGVGYRLGTMEADAAIYSTMRHVFGACAGAALYRKEFFDTIGLFDNDFFAYLEDVDINLRANFKGQKCLYVPAAAVYHIGSATSGSKINALTIRLSTRNTFFVLLKNYPLSLFFKYFSQLFLYQFMWFCFVVKKRQFIPYVHGVVQAVRSAHAMRRKHRLLYPEKLRKPISDLDKILKTSEVEVLDSIMRRRRALGKGNGCFNLYKRFFT